MNIKKLVDIKRPKITNGSFYVLIRSDMVGALNLKRSDFLRVEADPENSEIKIKVFRGEDV